MRGRRFMLKTFGNIKCRLLILLVVLLLFFNFLNLPVIAEENDLPDIEILSVDYDKELTENKMSNFIVKIKNRGSKNLSGEEIKVALFLDQLADPVSYNSTTDDLDIGKSMYINISWMPSFGDDKQYSLSIIVNHEELFDEESFDNNFRDFLVTINEKDTNLEITDVKIPDEIYVNKTSTIITNIINNGRTTNKKIVAKMNTSINGEVETLKKEGLDRDELFIFNFSWVPSKVGIQKINIYVFLEEELHDTFEEYVLVSARDFKWWNESWHYRYFLSVKGKGNFSKFFNFSEILEDLGVFSYHFENEKIRIVKYSEGGEIIDDEISYNFAESDNFSKTDNALGNLEWKVSGNSDIKYYLIYFDVEENRGLRNGDESIVGAISDDVVIYNEGFYESWWANIINPSHKDPIILDKNNKVDFYIKSVAKISNVSFYGYNLDTSSCNSSFYLIDTGTGTSWYKNDMSFCKEGNWSFNISCLDKAGLYYNFSDIFYIGKPDLEIKDISIAVENTPSSAGFHRNDKLNISALAKSSFISLEDVNVSFEIFDIEHEKFIFKEIKSFNFTKDKITKIHFNWIANISGKLNFTIRVDPNNSINETNENNNDINKKITIYDWPDLYVEDIFLPSEGITEFDEVQIDFVIVNQGLGNADEYKVGLFIEKISGKNPTMLYENMVDSKIIDIKKDSSKTFSLYWDSAKPGSWFVGIRIFYNESKYDSNRWNNKLLSSENLMVKAIESNSPLIKNVIVNPSNPRQGDRVVIKAEIYDDTGLKKISIEITDPLDKLYNGMMIRTFDDQFKYEFDFTSRAGEYVFVIEAVDSTVKNSTQTEQGIFSVKKDIINPEIIYFGVEPMVQLLNKSVEISCIVHDNFGVSSVELMVVTPDEIIYQEDMELEKDGKYVYKNIYENIGSYSYDMKVIDKSGNTVKTSKKYFWITTDLADSDADGMPDSWEEKYNLDRFDASDAEVDLDNDGYTNLEEYNMGTNPRKNIVFQNVAYEIRDNIWYLILSTILFFSLLLIAYYGKRRTVI